MTIFEAIYEKLLQLIKDMQSPKDKWQKDLPFEEEEGGPNDSKKVN